MSTIYVGVLLEVLAAALGTASKQLIAYSSFVQKTWVFHLGAGINILVGPVVDTCAYAFAPQIVVAPFACLDVIFNMMTAPTTLRWQNERITWVHVLSAILVAAGACLTAVFGSVEDDVLTVKELERQLTRWQSLAYMAAELVAIAVISVALRARRLPTHLRGVALGVIAGVLMGNVFFIKGFVGIVRTSWEEGIVDAFARLTPYGMVAAAAGGSVLGHVFMKQGLKEYKGVYMVTIFEGSHVTAACLSGCIVMSELADSPWWRFVLYWLSVAVILAGVLVANSVAKESQSDQALASPMEPAASFEEQLVPDRPSGAPPRPRVGGLPAQGARPQVVQSLGTIRSFTEVVVHRLPSLTPRSPPPGASSFTGAEAREVRTEASAARARAGGVTEVPEHALPRATSLNAPGDADAASTSAAWSPASPSRPPVAGGGAAAEQRPGLGDGTRNGTHK